ncbi:hypothetical protein ABK040_012949 [Willaertia magna]
MFFNQQTTDDHHSKRGFTETLLDFSPINNPIKQHLFSVYSLLAGLILFSTLGCYYAIISGFNSGLSSLLTFVLSLFVYFTSTTTSQVPLLKQYGRLSLLACLGFFQGAAIGPLVNVALDIDPYIVVLSLLATSTIFICFSVSTLLSKQNERSFLLLSGLLSSAVSILFWLSLFNIFIHSELLFNIQLYGGLLVFVGYVMYDTQLIIEKVRLLGIGNVDPIRHALELFVDLVAIFVRILIILMKKEKKRKD